ncbi:MAG: HlyD family efflux transporter periplasmic adaptor subunit [Pisciglobus halotolerans]|nr:HlyD family efflux transporter periplasmic adaptor subunit [Pisciglobus halotolerans]
MNWKKIVGILVVLAVIGYIGYAVFFTGGEEKEVTVRVTDAAKESITETLSLSGTVKPSEMQNVFGQGIVTDLPVEVGDTVEKGDKLISYENVTIPAKFDGTVTEVNIKENEPDTNAQTGMATIVLANLKKLQVGVDLTKSEASAVKKDQKATLTSGKDIYKGRVKEIDPMASADPTAPGDNPTVHAIVTFDKEPEDLIAGFDIDTEIATSSKDNALTIPIEALVYNSDNKPFVYTVKNSKINERPVEVGLQSVSKVEITDGLKSGETVVLSPDTDLKNDQTVTTQEIE